MNKIIELCINDYENNNTVSHHPAHKAYLDYLESIGLPLNVQERIAELEANASHEFEKEYFEAGFNYGKLTVE